MATEGPARAARGPLGLGRLLPLGDTADGAWLAEPAATSTLRAAAAAAVREARVDALRVSPGGPGEDAAGDLAPPSALPHGPLRIDADFAATPDAPLPEVGQRLRTALLRAADEQLGLRVATADLHVTDLLDGPEGDGTGTAPEGGRRPAHRHPADDSPPAPADSPHAVATAEAVIAVPGVARLAPAPGAAGGSRWADGVSVTDSGDGEARPEGGTDPAGRHLRIQIAVTEGSRALDVARAVRQAAVRAAAWDAAEGSAPVTVTVLVTAIDPAIGSGGERVG